MIRKTAILAFFIFFAFGVAFLTAAEESVPTPAAKAAAKPAAKPAQRGKGITQFVYDWVDSWSNVCVSKRDRHCFGTWDSK